MWILYDRSFTFFTCISGAAFIALNSVQCQLNLPFYTIFKAENLKSYEIIKQKTSARNSSRCCSIHRGSEQRLYGISKIERMN